MIDKNTIKRRIPLGICLILFIVISNNNQAQSIKRQCISSYGTCTNANNVIFTQTVGQPYNILPFYEVKTSLLPGFQQPAKFKAETINSKLLKNLNLVVYPNPTAYSLTIKSNEVIEKPVISVTDLNGKPVFKEEVSLLSSHNINCAAWENGVYIITICDKYNNKSFIKLLINK